MRIPILFTSAVLFLSWGCSCPVHSVRAARVVPQSVELVTLYEHPLEVRLSGAWQKEKSGFLVVYATGDGGWRGLDAQMFDWITDSGFPVAGFSSKSYLKNMGYVSETTTPERLVSDYELIIGFAESRLHLPPSTRIILAGLSRGAGLSVVAAGEGALKPRLAGVIAVALTREEEYVRRMRMRRGPDGKRRREPVEIRTYRYLSRLAELPVSVIQSTGDNYLDASTARRLFGPDTGLRQLHAIDARNHRFSGGCNQLYCQTQSALNWIRDFDLRQHPAESGQTQTSASR